MNKKIKSDYAIQAVINAINLMEVFGGEQDELDINETSKKLSLLPSYVERMLKTLGARGYVEQNKATGKYRLGLKIFELGQIFIKHLNLRKESLKVLKDVVDKCNETAYISVIRGNDVIYLDGVEANHPIRVISRVGYRIPPHCTSAGKVLIAYLALEELEKFLTETELVRFTPNTITSREELIQHLIEVKDKGYARDREEFEEGVGCIGVPIRDFTGKVMASLSISGPIPRLSEERIEKELLPSLVETGIKLSHRLGYSSISERNESIELSS